MKAVAVGDITIDQSYILDEFVREDFKHAPSKVVYSVGGPSAIAALFLSRMGIDTTLYGNIGRDAYGKRAKMTLVREKVKVIENIQKRTKVHTYLINTASGTRTGIKSPIEYRKPVRISYRDASSDLFIFDRNSFRAFMYVVKHRKKNSILIVDTSVEISHKAFRMLRHSTHPVISIEAVKQFDAKSNWMFNASAIRRIVEKDLVITAGGSGSYICREKEILHIPAYSVNAVDTLGAGDVFRGAFAYALLRGLDMERACRFANFASAMHCTKFGNSSALPSCDDLNKALKNGILDKIRSRVLERNLELNS